MATAASTKSSATRTSSRRKAASHAGRQYVLDTNVLIHDPTALYNFAEHDVHLPMTVLEELDKHKKGTSDIARNARTVTRSLDQLLPYGNLIEGFSLAELSEGKATGRLFFQSDNDTEVVSGQLQESKADNLILACAMVLQKKTGNAVLVTKDINLRVKAMALGQPSEDYRTDRVVEDADYLPKGCVTIDTDFWAQPGQSGENLVIGSWHFNGSDYLHIDHELALNSFLQQDDGMLWQVVAVPEGREELDIRPGQSLLRSAQDYTNKKRVMLNARNDEQNMALNLLHNEDIDFVALLGPAGSGKTLLALAAGLEQYSRDKYSSVLITRATVPMGEEIGFLPGDEQDKMNPWIGGTLRDCYEAMQLKDGDMLRSAVEIASMSFMRGRSFQQKFIIIDEAQNLTIPQMVALLTRAGNGTKIVVTGNISQIDTPYLDAASSGLTWAAKNLQNWAHAGHLILEKCERSRLAAYVEDLRNGKH